MDSLILLKNRPNLEDTIEPVGLSATFLNAIVRRGPLKEESCMFSISRSLTLAPVVCLLISAVVAHAEDTPSEQSPALPPALVEFITGAGGSAAQDLAGAAQPAAFVVARQAEVEVEQFAVEALDPVDARRHYRLVAQLDQPVNRRRTTAGRQDQDG